VRISTHFYNDEADVDACIEASWPGASSSSCEAFEERLSGL